MDSERPERRKLIFFRHRFLLCVVLSALGILPGCNLHRNDSRTPPKEVPASRATEAQVPAEGASAAPADNSPADKSPADESPADESPADESPADNSAAVTSPARADEKRPLTGLDSTYTSAEALSRAVLKALKERDEKELNRLRVNYREYSELLFPHFEAAKPPRTIPVEFHWKLLNTKSINGARDALQSYGGQEFELLEVVPTKGVDEYPTFRLIRKVQLKLRRVSDGKVATVTIFGSIVEMNGKFKLLSYPS